MGGFSWEYTNSKSSDLVARNFVNEALKNQNMGAGNPEQNGVSNGYSTSTMLSWMARLNYTYDNKYADFIF